MIKNRILDFEQLNECLDNFTIIKEEVPLGNTQFGYPIRHFSFGSGENHVIITAGTHSTELITNQYVIHFMEQLEKNPFYLFVMTQKGQLKNKDKFIKKTAKKILKIHRLLQDSFKRKEQ